MGHALVPYVYVVPVLKYSTYVLTVKYLYLYNTSQTVLVYSSPKIVSRASEAYAFCRTRLAVKWKLDPLPRPLPDRSLRHLGLEKPYM